MNAVKNRGEVFTPKHIVKDMLDSINYRGENTLQKHIIDNSCGDGAFLTEIVQRYIDAFNNKKNSNNLKIELETYIHGIEIDNTNYCKCIQNLNKVAFLNGLIDINWDIRHADALEIDDYNNKMDYVVGNPPYVRIHNLTENLKNKKFSFSQNGMTDLYLTFYEIGFNMLNETGKLTYITPNSILTSDAGETFRNFIKKQKELFAIYDLGHYQPFKFSTYTVIMNFNKSQKNDMVNCYKYNQNGEIQFVSNCHYENLFIENKIIISNTPENIKNILEYVDTNKIATIKNGFATLCDKVFISDDFSFSENVIDVVKASTGQWRKCIFPYKKDITPIKFEELGNNDLKKYLLENKNLLIARSLEKNAKWYTFGRSQALNDVYKNKIAINNLVKDINSIKLTFVPSGKGVYSGLYIVTDVSFNKIETLLKSNIFIEYIKSLNKCKSGGYYSFSSKDLSKFLNYFLTKEKTNG